MNAHEVSQLSLEQIAKLKDACLADFNTFLTLFTDDPFYDKEVQWKQARFLQFDKSNRKVITVPRSFLKTHVVSRYMAWLAIQDSNTRILYVTNSATNAEKVINMVRMLFEREMLIQQMFPEIIPNFNKVRWSDKCAELVRDSNHAEGTFESAGTNTNIIGRHYNYIIEDDTVAPKKSDIRGGEVMPDRISIEQAIGWHMLAHPLLVDPTDTIIVQGTRWCKYDLINHVQENEKAKYSFFEIKAYKDPAQRIPTYKRFPLNVLDGLRDTLGSYLFSALYLNDPTSGAHMVFQDSWLRFVSQEEYKNEGHVVISLDPAIGESTDSDETAIVAVRHLPGLMIVEETVHDQMTPNRIISEVYSLAMKYGSTSLIVETVQFQKSLVYGFKDEGIRRNFYLSVTEFASRVSKEERIRGLQPIVEQGRLWYRKSIDGTLESQMLGFPYTVLDDVLDALAMQLLEYNPDYEKAYGMKSEKEEVKELKNTYCPFPTWTMANVLAELKAKKFGRSWMRM